MWDTNRQAASSLRRALLAAHACGTCGTQNPCGDAAMHTYSSTHTTQQYTYVQQCTRCNTFRPLPSPSVITDAQHAVLRSSRAHADLQVALVAERADAAHRLCGRGMHE